MNHADYKRYIEARVRWINKILGENYKLSFHKLYGGWQLYRETETGGWATNGYGTAGRYESKEMLAYLEGIWTAIRPF